MLVILILKAEPLVSGVIKLIVAIVGLRICFGEINEH